MFKSYEMYMCGKGFGIYYKCILETMQADRRIGLMLYDCIIKLLTYFAKKLKRLIRIVKVLQTWKVIYFHQHRKPPNFTCIQSNSKEKLQFSKTAHKSYNNFHFSSTHARVIPCKDAVSFFLIKIKSVDNCHKRYLNGCLLVTDYISPDEKHFIACIKSWLMFSSTVCVPLFQFGANLNDFAPNI